MFNIELIFYGSKIPSLGDYLIVDSLWKSTRSFDMMTVWHVTFNNENDYILWKLKYNK
jgi:hypothetical protein